MTNRKTLDDVIIYQENILNAIKSLENHIKDIQTRQERLETVMTEKTDEINSLLKRKVEISQKIVRIEENIDILSKVIENRTNKDDNTVKKRPVRKCKVDPVCEICESTFPRHCDLEDHMETRHSCEKRFNCDECGKLFVTKWRLEKHRSMHTSKTTKACKYYTEGIYCPFEKFGCKFLHVITKPCEEYTMDSVDESIDASHNENGMKSSTPISNKRRILRCLGNCYPKSECANCIVREMLENGEICLDDSKIVY